MAKVFTSKYWLLLIHILGWAGYFLFQILTENHFGPNGSLTHDTVWWIIQMAIILFFYVNYLALIPFLLQRKRYFLYALSIIAILVLTLFGLDFFIHSVSDKLPDSAMNPANIPHHHGPPPDDKGIFKGLSVFIMVYVISTGLKMTSEWFRGERQKQVLANEKLTAEITALKAQINPHFIFNVLNNICSLARKKSDETETYIIKLSQLLRYNLYEDKGGKILLEKEISFLTQYIDLQKMRLGDEVSVILDIELKDSSMLIEPMLLFPFIENAFKHGISYSEHSEIKIRMKAEGKILFFSVTNPIVTQHSNLHTEPSSGIGLTNVNRRLELLYPQKHNILVNQENGLFTVSLEIDLS
ncbi:MAG: histidine kinase [Bacteroidales bacterium]|nr:histidine kinase [Bacteroidales bacterium]HOY39494.1 histidine kinase [Bacteroidales bacterium]